MFRERFEKLAIAAAPAMKALKGGAQKAVSAGKKAVGNAHRLDVARQAADPLKTPVKQRLQAVKAQGGVDAFKGKDASFFRSGVERKPTLYKGEQTARPQFANQRTERKMNAANAKNPVKAAPPVAPATSGSSAGGFAGQFADRAKSLHSKAVSTWGNMSTNKKVGVAAGAAGGAGIIAGRMSRGDQQNQY